VPVQAVVQYGRLNRLQVEHSIRRPEIEPRQLADALMEMIAEKKASRIVLLDMQGISLIADYFVICSGESSRQLDAIADAALQKDRVLAKSPLRVEGTSESGWILVDFGSVILHIFDLERREFYQLEELWSHARVLTVIP
jgi:ribosome-associated protein